MSKLNVFRPIPVNAADLPAIRAALDKDGVCVVTNILSLPEQREFLDLFWQSVTKRNTQLRREDPSSWTEDNTDWYGTFGAGQYKHYGMAQEAHCWLIRKNKKIRSIFEEGIFAQDGVKEDCCVSLDGCAALFRPCVSGLKLHVDEVPGLPGSGWGSVQGAYNLYAVDTNAEETRASAGFACVVGSHREYDCWMQAATKAKGYKPPKDHWCTLPPDSPLQQRLQIVASPANSLVVWRSDLAHKNYGGDFTTDELTAADPVVVGEQNSAAKGSLNGSQSGERRLARLTQFVTFQPSKYRTEEARHRKAQSVLDGVCNNHWAALSKRVPITPFPAWSAAAKKIPCILPFQAKEGGREVAEEGEGGEGAEDGGAESGPKRKRAQTGGASARERCFAALPADVLDLL
jgi:hypothetical protein